MITLLTFISNMGGNAIKTLPIRRYCKNEYNKLCIEVINILTKFLNIDETKVNDYFRITKSYTDKETYGDIDIIINSDTVNTKNNDIDSIIENCFHSKEIHKNSNMYSFSYKDFQIDFVIVCNDYYESTYNYYNWNDLNILIGKIAHRLNLVYTTKGLFYKHTYKNTKNNIPLTKDIALILDILGFDFETYNNGFTSMKSIFDFVINSKYFSRYVFLNKNSNSKYVQKREMYNEFIKYIAITCKNNKSASIHYKNSIDMISNYFPFIHTEIKTYNETNDRKEIIKQKFNKNILKEKYNILDTDIRVYIKNFKDYIKTHVNKDFNEYIYETSLENIYIDFEKQCIITL